ncbi:MAG: hypothetical protein EHM20_09170 [Alphaproteobacteria bacterium]|nr:MAG: hypothetical protein EHM20_09170 [Alphaproteobacteria bacterium]
MKYLIALLILFMLIPFPALAGDEMQINKLIQSGNGIVKLESKNYIIENPIIMKSNTVLLGTGQTTFTLKSGVKWDLWVPVIKGTNLQNIRIAYINLDMNCDNQTVKYGLGYHNGIFLVGCSNVEIDHCSLINGKGDGARFKTCSNLKIHDNRAKRLGHDCIYIVDCKNATIINNKVTTRTNSGIRDWNSINVLIQGNTIDAQQDGYGGYGGMQIEYSKFFDNPKVEICRNIMTNTQGPGIQLIAYGNGLKIKKGINIRQNQFIQTGVSTSIKDAGGISIIGLKGASISNNVGDGCYNAFLVVMSGGESSTVKNNIITNTRPHNIIRPAGTGYGISNRAGTSFIIDSNCFWNNENGDLYKCTAKNSDLKDPKTHTTSSGWKWSSGKWVFKK